MSSDDTKDIFQELYNLNEEIDVIRWTERGRLSKGGRIKLGELHIKIRQIITKEQHKQITN